MVAEGFRGNRGLVPSSPSVRLLNLPALPATDTAGVWMGRDRRAVEVVHARCAGLDISKRDAKVCVRIAGAGRRKTVETVTTWSSMTSQILALRDHLIVERITCVVMEATSDYWKPFYYLLEDAGFDVLLVNARHVKNLPGRKTDVADATWLAQLGAHGLVRASFVPPEPIRHLRDLTRARTAITRERSREVQRLEKLLEDAGIKLSAVASDILGVSGRAMAGVVDRREQRPRRTGRSGQAPAALQDSGVDRGVDWSVHRASCVLGPGAPGPGRPAHRSD